jgi:hypothetical protein
MVDRARLHSLRSVPLAPSPWFFFLDVVNEDARDLVAGSSSPAAPSRSSRTATRTARCCCTGYRVTQRMPQRGYSPKGILHDHCLSPGEEEAVPSG